MTNVQIVGIECDVSVETSVRDAYKIIMTTFGRIDVVVASAGIFLFIFRSSSGSTSNLLGIVHNYPALEYVL